MRQSRPIYSAYTDELLSTKLAPPRLYSSVVPRELLLARLDEGLKHKLTLLSAPAGFGKTTLVSQWIGARSQETRGSNLTPTPRTAWVSLDAGDNDPVRFWRYVITACQRFAPELGWDALKWMQTVAQPSWETVLTKLLNDLAALIGEADQAVLVLEDYHVITAAQVHKTLTFFLEHLPVTFHLIITTRHDPPLPLAQWRARNELNELRALDLRFSREETRLFFQQSRALPLAPAAITYLADRTEGWVAGLHLAALALQKRLEPQAMSQFLATFRGSHDHIFAYLVTEVLHAQPDSRQEFLLQTSVLSRLCGALCDAVTGRTDSELVLEQLEQANLFLVPFLDDQGQSTETQGVTTWYRYHALFVEAMLQAARRRWSDDELHHLSHKASLWYEQHGWLDEAIETALTAQDFGRAADLIERTIDPLNRNYEHHTLRRWLEPLPEAVLRTHPALAFLEAVAILFTSDRRAPATLALLQTPLQIAEQHWSAAREKDRLGAVFAFRALLAWLQGELAQAFAHAKQALAYLPGDEAQWRDICLIFMGVEELQAGHLAAAAEALTKARLLCEVTGNEFGGLDAAILLGEVYTRQGELQQAAQLYRHVLIAAESAQMEREQAQIRVSNALIGLSILAYEWNELEAAAQQASQALAIGEQVAYVDLQLRVELILVRLDQAAGEIAAAQQRLHGLVAQTAQPRWSALLRRVRAEQARLALAAGDLAALEHWFTPVASQEAELTWLQQEQEALLLARLLIAQGETEAALSRLERWHAEAVEQGRTGSRLEILVLQSLAHSAANHLPQAHQTLLEALRLAQPKGYQRLFVDEGTPLARLLPGVLARVSDEPLRSYVHGLLTALGVRGWEPREGKPAVPVSALTAPLFEPLSDRELDVLKLVAAGLATEEVARELIISVGTVRTHLKHIYGKLDAHSRLQAVERARALNLI